MIALLIGMGLAVGAGAYVVAPLFRDQPPSEGRPECPTCGPRPEAHAAFCSACGRELIAHVRAPSPPDA